MLEVEDSGQHWLVKRILQLEVTREMGFEKCIQFFFHCLCRSSAGEWEIFVLSVNIEVFGDDVVEFINERRDRLDLFRINWLKRLLFIIFVAFFLIEFWEFFFVFLILDYFGVYINRFIEFLKLDFEVWF